MKNKTNKQTKQTKKNDDIVIVKNDKNENVEIKRDVLRDDLLSQLRIATNKRDTRECKRLRNKLRKQCKHYGALRNRTYIDKNDSNKRIIVNDANDDTRVSSKSIIETQTKINASKK